MKTMFVLISHPLTYEQESEARRHFEVDRFLYLGTATWCAIPADTDSVLPHLSGIFERLRNEAKEGDILFVQGDFGATFAMVQFARSLGIISVYATTERDAIERVEGKKVITTRTFCHVRFRGYEWFPARYSGDCS